MTLEQRAEAIMRALDIHPANAPAIHAAVEAAMIAGAEAMREAAALEACTRDLEHPKGCWCSSCTLNDAEREIRALDASAVIKRMGHG